MPPRRPTAFRAALDALRLPRPGELERLRQQLDQERARTILALREAEDLRHRLAAAKERSRRLALDAQLRKGVRQQLAGRRGADRDEDADAARAAAAGPAALLFARVHLSPEVPDDLLAVFERALLRHHHPDPAAPGDRDAATRRFQDVARTFQAIRKLRGLPS